MASVFIPNGKYEIYFVYSNKPDALFKGDDFSLNNNGVEIRIVKVVGGNYGIRQVNSVFFWRSIYEKVEKFFHYLIYDWQC